MSNAPDDPIDLAMFTIAKYGDDSHKPSVRLALEVRRMVAEIALLRSGLLEAIRIAEEDCEEIRHGATRDERSGGCSHPTCMTCHPEHGDPASLPPNPRLAELRKLTRP